MYDTCITSRADITHSPPPQSPLYQYRILQIISLGFESQPDHNNITRLLGEDITSMFDNIRCSINVLQMYYIFQTRMIGPLFHKDNRTDICQIIR